MDNQAALLPGTIALLQEAFAIYRPRLKTFIALTLIPQLLIPPLGFIFGLAVVLARKDLATALPVIVIAAISFIAFVVIQLWFQVAQILAVADPSLNFKSALKNSWPKIAGFWWVSLLAMFITMGGFVLLIIPGIIFLLWFSFAPYIYISEGVTGLSALLKSRAYTRGRLLAILWRFLSVGLILILIYLLSGFIFNLLHLRLLSALFNLIFSLIATPVSLIYAFITYQHVKSLTGNLDLTPTSSQKLPLILLAIFGPILLFIIPSAIIILVNPVKHLSISQDARRRMDINAIDTAIRQYAAENYGRYPISLSDPKMLDILPVIPVDPETKKPYPFTSTGDTYHICTLLQNKSQVFCLPENTTLPTD